MPITGASFQLVGRCFGGRFLPVIFVLLASSTMTTVLQVTAESKVSDHDDVLGKSRSSGPLGAAQGDDVTDPDAREPTPDEKPPGLPEFLYDPSRYAAWKALGLVKTAQGENPHPPLPDSPSWAAIGPLRAAQGDDVTDPDAREPTPDGKPLPEFLDGPSRYAALKALGLVKTAPLPLPDSPSWAVRARHSDATSSPSAQEAGSSPLAQARWRARVRARSRAQARQRRRQKKHGRKVSRQMLRRVLNKAARKHSVRKDILHSVKKQHRHHQKQILDSARWRLGREVEEPKEATGSEDYAGEAVTVAELDPKKQRKYIMEKIRSWGKHLHGKGLSRAELDLMKRNKKYIMKQLKLWGEDRSRMLDWLGGYKIMDTKQAARFFTPEAKISKSRQSLRKLVRMVKEQDHRKDGEDTDDHSDEYGGVADPFDGDDDDLTEDDSNELDAILDKMHFGHDRFDVKEGMSQGSEGVGHFDSSEKEDKFGDHLHESWDPKEDSSENKESLSTESDKDRDSHEDTAEVESTDDQFNNKELSSSELYEGSDSDEDEISAEVGEHDTPRRRFDAFVNHRWSRRKHPVAFPPPQHQHGRKARRMQHLRRRRLQRAKNRRHRLQAALKRRSKAARRRVPPKWRAPPRTPAAARRTAPHGKIFTLIHSPFPPVLTKPLTSKRPVDRKPPQRRRWRKLRRQWRKRFRQAPHHAARGSNPLNERHRNVGVTRSETTSEYPTGTSPGSMTTNKPKPGKETTSPLPFPRSSNTLDTDVSTPAQSATTPHSSRGGSYQTTADPYVDLTPVRATHLGRVEVRKPENHTLDLWKGQVSGSSGGSGRDLPWPDNLYIRVPYNQQDGPQPVFTPEPHPADRRSKRSAGVDDDGEDSDGDDDTDDSDDNTDDTEDDDNGNDDDSDDSSDLPLQRVHTRNIAVLPRHHRPTQNRAARRNTAPRVVGINGYNSNDNSDADFSPSASSPHSRRHPDYRRVGRTRSTRRRDRRPQTGFHDGNNYDDDDVDDNDDGNGRDNRASGLGFIQIVGRGSNNRGSVRRGTAQRRVSPHSRQNQYQRRGNRSRGESVRRQQRRLNRLNAQRMRRLQFRQQQRQQRRRQRQRQRQETTSPGSRPDRDDDDDNSTQDGLGNSHHQRPQIQHISIHNDDENGDSEAYIRSPFINHRTAYDFLSSQAGRRPRPGSRPYAVAGSRSRNNEQQNEHWQFSHRMSESLCEVFDKHFEPNNAGGRCV